MSSRFLLPDASAVLRPAAKPRAVTRWSDPSALAEGGDGPFVEALDLAGAERHATAWNDLAERSLEPNPFMSPGFCLPAARHLGRTSGLVFLMVWEPDHAAFGWKPSQGMNMNDAGGMADDVVRRPVPPLRHHASGGARRLLAVVIVAPPRFAAWPMSGLWFHDLSTLGAPLLDRTSAAPALTAVLSWLRRQPGARAALSIASLPAEGPTAMLLEEIGRRTRRRVHLLDPRTRAVLPVADKGDRAGLDAVSRPHAKDIRRQRRRLDDLGVLRFESVAREDGIEAATERFLALESAGWKGRAGTALAGTGPRAAFVREMVKAMAARGCCRVDTLWLDDRPIAMGIVLASRDREYFWKTAFAEDLAKLSPGVQFVLELTRAQQARPAIAMTDSCAMPDHPMIDRLWPDRMVVADAMVETVSGSGWRFAFALALEVGRRRARSRLKTLLAQWRRRRARSSGGASSGHGRGRTEP